MSDSDNGQLGPVGNLVIGFILVVAAIWMYTVFTKYETSGGHFSMPRIAVVIYSIVGKWGIVIPVGLIGIDSVWSGIKKLRGPG